MAIDREGQVYKNRKIGIMGGTFDPIHYGHLFIAQTALYEEGLDRVIFIPTGRPPHKRESRVTEGCKRIHMLRLAVEANPKFHVSTIEVDRKETSYTIDTIRQLQEDYGQDTQLYFIMGSDAFNYIESWKQYRELLKMVNFIVMTRQLGNYQELDDKINLLREGHGANIRKIQIPFLQISSTDIRKRIKEESFIKYLLPENVEAYIIDRGLYID